MKGGRIALFTEYLSEQDTGNYTVENGQVFGSRSQMGCENRIGPDHLRSNGGRAKPQRRSRNRSQKQRRSRNRSQQQRRSRNRSQQQRRSRNSSAQQNSRKSQKKISKKNPKKKILIKIKITMV